MTPLLQKQLERLISEKFDFMIDRGIEDKLWTEQERGAFKFVEATIRKLITDTLASSRSQETHKGESWRKGYRQGIEESLKKVIEEIRGMVGGMKVRYKCGACDGAKCEHTMCCQALSDLLNKLK